MSGLKDFKNNIIKTINAFESSPLEIVGGFLSQGNISTFQAINWDSYQLKPIIVSSIIINILELSSPLYINILYTSILPSESVSSLIVLTGIVITLMLINGWLKSLRLSLTGDGGAKIDHKKRLEAMSHFLQINLDDFLSALESALENVTGEEVSTDMDMEADEGGDDEAADMKMDMDMDAPEGDMDMGMDDEEPGMRDMMENEDEDLMEARVNRIAARVAQRLMAENKKASNIDALTERIFNRLAGK